MGLTEFEALAAPPDWWLLRELGPRAAVVAAPNDIWFKARRGWGGGWGGPAGLTGLADCR